MSLAIEPLVWLQYSAPIIALYPIFTLMFGLGAKAVIAMTFLLTVSPIIINTSRGVRSVDAKLIQVDALVRRGRSGSCSRR